MVAYRDQTYCASPQCENKCGRKLTAEQEKEILDRDLLISQAYFCGVPEEYE